MEKKEQQLRFCHFGSKSVKGYDNGWDTEEYAVVCKICSHTFSTMTYNYGCGNPFDTSGGMICCKGCGNYSFDTVCHNCNYCADCNPKKYRPRLEWMLCLMLVKSGRATAINPNQSIKSKYIIPITTTPTPSIHSPSALLVELPVELVKMILLYLPGGSTPLCYPESIQK